MEKPEKIANPDFSGLIAEVEGFMDYMDSDEYCEDGMSDFEEGITAAAIKAVYGENAYKFINQRMR